MKKKKKGKQSRAVRQSPNLINKYTDWQLTEYLKKNLPIKKKEFIESEMRIGIVGSRKYTNSLKIKEFIWQLKQKFGNRLTIVSGGQSLGADGYAAQWAKYFEINYVEFPPRHFQWNRWCIKHPGWYGQSYKVSHFFTRNSAIVKYSHKIAFFIPNGIEIEESPGSYDAYKKANKAGLKVVILN